jgi:hypothetical protein
MERSGTTGLETLKPFFVLFGIVVGVPASADMQAAAVKLRHLEGSTGSSLA